MFNAIETLSHHCLFDWFLILKHLQEQSGNQSSGKSSRGQTRWKGASARKNQSSYMNVSSETLWSDIQELAELKYQVSYSITWGICTTGIIRDSLEVELVHFITLLSICHMGNIATISFVWGPLFYCLC
jgi:hypothetical protein